MPSASKSRVGAILLAAGSSSRLGTPKQLLSFRGVPLVRHVAEETLASRVAKLIVVVGSRSEDVRKAITGLDVEFVDNPAFLQGQSTSLRMGLLAFPRTLTAALIILVDQPYVDSTLIDRLIGLYEESGAAIVAPEFKGRRGNPVLFDHTLFPELLTVVGDTGARDVIVKHRDRLASVELADDRAFADVDTWDDYQRIRLAAE